MHTAWILLEVAAWLHLCQVPGTWFLTTRVVMLAAEVGRLTPLARAIVHVLGVAVVAVLVGLGILIGTFPEDVLGTRFGLGLCAFLGSFWLARLGAQVWYYFAFAWPRTLRGRVAHAALVAIFSTQATSYLLVWRIASVP